jgi:hypothetical protein
VVILDFAWAPRLKPVWLFLYPQRGLKKGRSSTVAALKGRCSSTVATLKGRSSTLRQPFQLLSCHHVTLAAGLEVGDAAFQRADHRVG